MEWVWGNAGKLYVALDHVLDEDVRDALLDALDEVLADPYGFITSPMRGTAHKADRRIAALPHGWYLVFTPFPLGLPPVMEPVVMVREFYPLSTRLDG